MKKILKKSNKFIPYSTQDISKNDIKEVVKVLNSAYLTQGPEVLKFENSIKKYNECKFATAMNSATSALHAACAALGVGKGDIVWTSSITFVASANCAVYLGAKVDFIDIDPLTNNLSLSHLEKKLIKAKKNSKLPKAIIPVHLSGLPCDMEKIYKLSKKYNFKIIEDASHALGAKYKLGLVGNCKYSDITVFSFHPVKIITSAEGGMAVTNSKKLDMKLKLFRGHGITRDPSQMKNKKNVYEWNYDQISIGYNYRMSDMHAALGLSQLKKINKFKKNREQIANFYDTQLKNLPVELPSKEIFKKSSLHLYIIKLKLEHIRFSKNDIMQSLRDDGILVNFHYMPVYHHEFYKHLGFKKNYCKEAEKYNKSAISMPIYPSLTRKEQNRVINSLKKALS